MSAGLSPGACDGRPAPCWCQQASHRTALQPRLTATRPAAAASSHGPPAGSQSARQQRRQQRCRRRCAQPPFTSQAAGNSSNSSSSVDLGLSGEGLLTFEEVQQIASSRGLEISLKTLGPVYRVVCRDAASSSGSRRSLSGSEARAEEAAGGAGGSGRVLAVTSGFIVPPPLRLMHCDTLQVFTKGMKGEEGSRTRGGVMGLGLLLGAATFAYGRACGCRKAEILAINDDESWHDRLVSYYGRFGFKTVRVVDGSRLGDLPHMLVWGGAGTRMDADVDAMLARWTRAVRRNSAAATAPPPAAVQGPAEPAQAAAAAAEVGAAAGKDSS